VNQEIRYLTGEWVKTHIVHYSLVENNVNTKLTSLPGLLHQMSTNIFTNMGSKLIEGSFEVMTICKEVWWSLDEVPTPLKLLLFFFLEQLFTSYLYDHPSSAP
jgi:hypothetical protein